MPDFSSIGYASISEIFSSLQGEGPLLGERHIFIRFAGCDVQCSYCDEHAKHGQRMPLEKILAEVGRLERSEGPHSLVSVTGGEPLLQHAFLTRLLSELHSSGLRILLETNGIHWEALRETLGQCDVISMDLKLASVGRHKDFLEAHRKFLTIARDKELYIKIIVSKGLDLDEFDRHIAMIAETAPDIPVYIQPVWNEMADADDLLTGLISRANDRIQNVRLGLQLHKILNMR